MAFGLCPPIMRHRETATIISSFLCGCIFMYSFLLLDDIYDQRRSRIHMLPPDSNQKSVFQHSITTQNSTLYGEDLLPSNVVTLDTTLARELYSRSRVLCWILTTFKNHKSKAIHVKETWGKRCNILIFMSDSDDPALPAVKIVEDGSYSALWGKTKAAFKYCYEHYKDKADWFLKADDDSYYIMENLRLLLHQHDPNKPVYFGRRFKPFNPQGYMSGGAGYVLSAKALELFVTKSLRTPADCKVSDDSGAEDAEMGKCLYNVGVTALDSRDELKYETFHPFTPDSHLNDHFDNSFWLTQYNYYPLRQGLSCCSSLSIAFHYINPNSMHTLDYLIYTLQVYGVSPVYKEVNHLMIGDKSTAMPNTVAAAEKENDNAKKNRRKRANGNV